MLSVEGDFFALLRALRQALLAALHSLSNQTVLTVRFPGLLFGIVFDAIVISFSLKNKIGSATELMESNVISWRQTSRNETLGCKIKRILPGVFKSIPFHHLR